MSARNIFVKKAPTCATLADQDGTRDAEELKILWLALLRGLVLIVIALRKYLQVERCDTCGR